MTQTTKITSFFHNLAAIAVHVLAPVVVLSILLSGLWATELAVATGTDQGWAPLMGLGLGIAQTASLTVALCWARG